MKILGYCRVSTSEQDVHSQRMQILDYAHKQKLVIDEFIESEASSRLSPKERKIDEILTKLGSGDILIVTELSRLGRNMLETLNIINEMSERSIQIVFLQQIELSTNNPHSRLLSAIYAHFAQTEREFISMRTKSGLQAAKLRGVTLGRPRGSKNVVASEFEQYKAVIVKHRNLDVPLASILKIINSEREVKLSYTGLRYYLDTMV